MSNCRKSLAWRVNGMNAPALLLCAITWLCLTPDAHACKCGSPDITEPKDLDEYTVFVGTAVEKLQWHDGCSWAAGFELADYPTSYVGTAYRFAVRAAIGGLSEPVVCER